MQIKETDVSAVKCETYSKFEIRMMWLQALFTFCALSVKGFNLN